MRQFRALTLAFVVLVSAAPRPSQTRPANIADVAFTGHNLSLIPEALQHARRGRAIINQNIVLSLGVRRDWDKPVRGEKKELDELAGSPFRDAP